MKILAIDTTEQACSAALWLDGEADERFQLAPRQHSRLILPMIEHLLADAELRLPALDGLAFGRGPGSFTGVRIAAAVAQGIALAVDLPVLPVSSLLALAQGVQREYAEPRVLAAFDARMQELYWLPCEVHSGRMHPRGAEQVSGLAHVHLPQGETGWAVVGSALGAYAEALSTQLGGQAAAMYPDGMVHAQDIAMLAQADLAEGRSVPPESALPVYLRDRVAQKA